MGTISGTASKIVIEFSDGTSLVCDGIRSLDIGVTSPTETFMTMDGAQHNLSMGDPFAEVSFRCNAVPYVTEQRKVVESKAREIIRKLRI